MTLLVSRNAGERFRRSEWATVLAILEPLAILFILGYIRDHVLRTPAPHGSSTTLFYATGLLPYYMFFHISQKIRGLDLARNIPTATWTDNAFATVIGEVCLKTIIMAIVILYLWMNGVRDTIPVNPLGCIPALAAIAVIAFAVGVINAIIISVFELWFYIYFVAARLMMLLSAVFFVMDFVPVRLRDMVVYNPIAQAMTWLRSNYYTNYPITTLDISYTVQVAACALLVAILLESATRSWREGR